MKPADGLKPAGVVPEGRENPAGGVTVGRVSPVAGVNRAGGVPLGRVNPFGGMNPAGGINPEDAWPLGAAASAVESNTTNVAAIITANLSTAISKPNILVADSPNYLPLAT